MKFSLRPRATATALSLVLLGSTACTPPKNPTNDAMLTDTVWQLQQIQYSDGTVLAPTNSENYTIQFMEDGRVGVQADCNRVLGEFTGDSSSLAITLGASTLAACGPDSLDTEFTQALSNAALYFFQNNDLLIDLQADSGTLKFSPAPMTSALTGTVWQLEQIQYNNDTLLTANPPENYTVEFMADGSVIIRADCNRARGQFTEEGAGSVAITVDAVSRAACPPGSISNEFLQGLNDAATYFLQDGTLFMDIKYGTGTLRFRPTP